MKIKVNIAYHISFSISRR